MTVHKTVLSLLLFVTIACSCRQPKRVEGAKSGSIETTTVEDIFPENSIGVVYLDTANGNNYSITIRFPNFSFPDSLLKRDSSNYTKDIALKIAPQTIILFDEAGELLTLENVTSCVSKFWCENDGGQLYEPTYTLTISRDRFKRPLQIKNSKVLDKLSCFAVANYKAAHFKSFYPERGYEDSNVVMRGRLSSDYSGYAKGVGDRIYAYYDRNVQIIAEEDDSPMTDYCIRLQAFNTRANFELGCCGP
jgi:hypothetical protein